MGFGLGPDCQCCDEDECPPPCGCVEVPETPQTLTVTIDNPTGIIAAAWLGPYTGTITWGPWGPGGLCYYYGEIPHVLAGGTTPDDDTLSANLICNCADGFMGYHGWFLFELFGPGFLSCTNIEAYGGPYYLLPDTGSCSPIDLFFPGGSSYAFLGSADVRITE